MDKVMLGFIAANVLLGVLNLLTHNFGTALFNLGVAAWLSYVYNRDYK